MAGYSPTVLDEIRSSIDLVDLIGRFVNLRKAGASFKALCPFHAEKTPSFVVNPRKGVFHCFGCGAGGDAFGFLMRQDRLSFPEAVRALAKQAGVALPEERGGAADSGREELYRVMDLAARFYSDALWTAGGERAREYLGRRGIDPEVARRFRLGYAPDGWEGLLGFMRSERLPAETLEAAGLVVRRESGGGHYDRFRARLMFAIRDVQGRVVAFGGRALGDEQPKYLNSPETPLYTKGNLLYALDLARAVMRERNRALLVEGYVDCLMAHQHGFTETVAVLGTALTPAHLRLLQRQCEEVVTFFDADSAGQKAAARAETLLDMSAGDAFWDPRSGGAKWMTPSGEFTAPGALRVKVALLPAGEDPDTFLRHHGAEALVARIAAARSLLSYALDQALMDPDGVSAPRARANAFARVALMLAKVADAQEAATLSREAAHKLGVDSTQLWIEAQKLQAALRRSPTAAKPTAVGAERTKDKFLVRLLLQHPPARAALLPLIEEEDVSGETLRTIVAALRSRPDASAESLLADLDESAGSVLAALLLEEDRRFPEDPKASIADFRRHLEREHRLRRQRKISRSIGEAQSRGGVVETPFEDFQALHRESKVVYEMLGNVAQSLDHGDATSSKEPTG